MRDIFQLFFEQSQDLCCTANDKLYFEQLNPAWESTLGWTREQLRAVPFTEFVHPADRDRTLETASRLQQPGVTPVDFIIRFRHQQGHWIPLSWTASFRGTTFYASARDVSELQETQRQSQEALSRLQSILESANYAIIETTTDGIIRVFNATAERMLGYSAEEVIDKETPALIHLPEEVIAHSQALSEELGETIEPGFETFVAKARRGQPEEREWTYVRKDGSHVPVSLSVTVRRDAQDEIMGFLGIAKDISARRHAEIRLQESERLLSTVFSSMAVGMVIQDQQGAIREVNPAAESILGLPREQLIGLESLDPNWRTTHPDGRPFPGSEHPAMVALRTGEPQNDVQMWIRSGEDRQAMISVNSRRLPAPENSQAHMVVSTFRDITHRKLVEKLQSEFISTVSHELRTPLTSIRGSLGLLSGGMLGELPEEAREYVDIALHNSDRLVRLINDILDIEKIQSGSMELRSTTTELAQAVRTAAQANAGFATSHQASLQVLEPLPAGEVLVDPDRLAQVFANLISNAVKFSPPQGVVEIRSERKGHWFRVSVSDRGPGIPQQFEGRIFNRFAQADASSTRQKGGTGLGLSITKALVEKMRGRIGFCARESGGTTFFFELPYLHPVTVAPPDRRASQVLVCEDDPDIARMLESMLTSAGYQVHLSPTLERARRLLQEHTYDALTLDLILADGESAVLITEIRSQPATKNLPIIVVSGSQSPLGQAAILVSDVLRKPFAEDQLLAALQSAVANRQLTVPSILHVEDDPDICRIVKKTLPPGWEILTAPTLREARQALKARSFDVVLLDLSLPDGEGDELLGSVGRAQVIIFSAQHTSAELSQRVSAALVKAHQTPIDVRETILSLLGPAPSDSLQGA